MVSGQHGPDDPGQRQYVEDRRNTDEPVCGKLKPVSIVSLGRYGDDVAAKNEKQVNAEGAEILQIAVS